MSSSKIAKYVEKVQVEAFLHQVQCRPYTRLPTAKGQFFFILDELLSRFYYSLSECLNIYERIF